ncbi:hypothetical protein H2200_003910 [Cladophialophora chaetospira]|uniref:Uncharacterized protein n=1 Tax=Cladophialophora chaetospira TaxID=386627 RepID=A0AA38XF41_9EURO|nr:hypothetical protein H2200_003910 [Cladophialophora chaetospira]
MASSIIHVPEEITKAAEKHLEIYRTKHCRLNHKGTCRPKPLSSPGIGQKMCWTVWDDGHVNEEINCVVASATKSDCFKFPRGSITLDARTVLATISQSDYSTIETDSYAVAIPFNAWTDAPLYSPRSVLTLGKKGDLKGAKFMVTAYARKSGEWAYIFEDNRKNKWIRQSELTTRVKEVVVPARNTIDVGERGAGENGLKNSPRMFKIGFRNNEVLLQMPDSNHSREIMELASFEDLAKVIGAKDREGDAHPKVVDADNKAKVTTAFPSTMMMHPSWTDILYGLWIWIITWSWDLSNRKKILGKALKNL